MLAHPVVAAVSDRRRRSEIDATIYVPPYICMLALRPEFPPIMGNRKDVNAQNDSAFEFFASL
jgi:hypothetical protein